MSLGIYLVFGVLLAPLYLVLLGWFVGDPRDNDVALLGLALMIAVILGPIVFSFAPIAFRVIIPS